MLSNYIKISVRSLVRDTTYAVINIGGLAIGIAASILLTLWVSDELSYDRFHRNHERIYKLNANFENNGNPTTWESTNGPIAAFARREVAAVEAAARISGDNGVMLFRYGEREFAEPNNTAFVDSDFFEIFDFRLLRGNRKNPFPDPRSIIIDEATAAKYFGDEDPVGKAMQVDGKDEYIVRGVLENMPSNSSIRFSILFPFQILIDSYQPGDYWKSLETDWGNYNYHTYLLLQGGAGAPSVADELTSIHHKNQQGAGVKYSLQPLSMLHLYGPDMREAGIQAVRIFLIVAVAIILIACINYINLATARASKRAREVGVRKTIGADRTKLMSQFLVESAIVTTLAVFAAIIIIQLVIPFYNTLSGKTFVFSPGDGSVLTLILSALVLTWLIAGIYPALVLSSFQPIQVLRGKLTLSGANSSFRKILVITQFSLSIAIIIATLVVGQQLEFISSRNLGYSKDHTFAFGLRGDMLKDREAIRNELLRQPGITGTAMSNQNIMDIQNTTGDTDWEGKQADQLMMIHPMNIDEHFIRLMEMELVEGTGFTGARSDTAAVILNETAVKEAGIKDPVGKSFTLWDIRATIIGVVRDFHHHSMHKPIAPTAFFYRPGWQWLVYVKTDGKNTAQAVAACEKIWKQFNRGYPFEYNFMDSAYDKMYKSEQRMGQLFTVFSIIAVIISCLGLFGLTTFTTAQRVKEIGIRKVMGASVRQIVFILSKDFLKLVIIAMLIGIPGAWMLMSGWLQDFAYRITISWTTFLIAGTIAVTVAFATMSLQVIKAAFLNPVNSLRNE